MGFNDIQFRSWTSGVYAFGSREHSVTLQHLCLEKHLPGTAHSCPSLYIIQNCFSAKIIQSLLLSRQLLWPPQVSSSQDSFVGSHSAETQKISRCVVLKLVLSAFPCHIFCLFWESSVPTIPNGRQITAVNALLLHGATVDRQVGRWTGKRRQKHISLQLGAGSFTTNLWHPAASWDRGARLLLFFFPRRMGREGAFFGSVGMGMMHFCVLLLFSVFFWIVLVCVLQRRCIWWGKMEGHITSHSLVSLPSHGCLRTNSWQLWIVESVPHSWRWLRTVQLVDQLN